jgi:hypothetical protein
MDFLKQAASSVTKAVNFVLDKNRRSAMINRLKIVIKDEKEAQARAYIRLGKYYYETMRDAQNTETEPLCAVVDNTGERLKRAYARLDELAAPAPGCSCGVGPQDVYEDEEPETESEKTQPEDASGPDLDSLRPEMDAGQEEAADDGEFLRPFSVVPNDGKGEDGGEPSENSTDGDKQ